MSRKGVTVSVSVSFSVLRNTERERETETTSFTKHEPPLRGTETETETTSFTNRFRFRFQRPPLRNPETEMETDFTETRLVKEIERICIVALTSIFLGGERLHPPLQLTYLHPPPQTNVLKITKILNYTGLSQIHLTVIHLKAMVFKKNICFFLNAPKPGIITDSRHNFPHSASTINRSVMSKLHPRNCFPTPPKNIYLSRIVFSIFLNSFNYIYKLI